MSTHSLRPDQGSLSGSNIIKSHYTDCNPSESSHTLTHKGKKYNVRVSRLDKNSGLLTPLKVNDVAKAAFNTLVTNLLGAAASSKPQRVQFTINFQANTITRKALERVGEGVTPHEGTSVAGASKFIETYKSEMTPPEPVVEFHPRSANIPPIPRNFNNFYEKHGKGKDPAVSCDVAWKLTQQGLKILNLNNLPVATADNNRSLLRTLNESGIEFSQDRNGMIDPASVLPQLAWAIQYLALQETGVDEDGNNCEHGLAYESGAALIPSTVAGGKDSVLTQLIKNMGQHTSAYSRAGKIWDLFSRSSHCRGMRDKIGNREHHFGFDVPRTTELSLPYNKAHVLFGTIKYEDGSIGTFIKLEKHGLKGGISLVKHAWQYFLTNVLRQRSSDRSLAVCKEKTETADLSEFRHAMRVLENPEKLPRHVREAKKYGYAYMSQALQPHFRTDYDYVGLEHIGRFYDKVQKKSDLTIRIGQEFIIKTAENVHLTTFIKPVALPADEQLTSEDENLSLTHVVKVDGGGNCLFDAASRGLRLGGIYINKERLRHDVCAHLLTKLQVQEQDKDDDWNNWLAGVQIARDFHVVDKKNNLNETLVTEEGLLAEKTQKLEQQNNDKLRTETALLAETDAGLRSGYQAELNDVNAGIETLIAEIAARKASIEQIYTGIAYWDAFSLEDYINLIKNDREFGGEVHVRALNELYGNRFQPISAGQKPENRNEENDVFLRFDPEHKHYDLYLTEEQAARLS